MTKGNITAVICGAFESITWDILDKFVNNDRITKVIYSGWIGDKRPLIDNEKVVMVGTNNPKNCGPYGVNNFILPAYNGISFCNTKFVWKINSNLKFTEDEINAKLDKFDETFNQKSPKILTNILDTIPMSVDDVSMIGLTKSVREFWQCPLDNNPDDESAPRMFPTTYITCHYLKIYSTAAFDMLSNPHTYLFPNSPKRDQAMATSKRILPNYFIGA